MINAVTEKPTRRHRLWLATLLLIYLSLTCYQLGLPGLHYDEAREAGVSAMEIVTGAPVTLFRNTGLMLFGRAWPLMVQDYIGALNVYLALPLLWFTGIGVPNLRIVAILTGAVTLLLVERTVTEWLAFVAELTGTVVPTNPLFTRTGLIAITLLAASPSFVFWSRQGLFVTNLTEPLVFACLWQGLRWLRTGHSRHLLAAAFWGGISLYAKLLAVWIVGPFILLVGGWWFWRGRRGNRLPITIPTLGATAILFLLPLAPLFWFNLQSSGTVHAVTANLSTSYYGVNNLAIWSNLSIRLAEAWQMIVGAQFWYLGGLYSNSLAGWATMLLLFSALLITSGQRSGRSLLLGPLLLLLLTFLASIFTLSDLFVTHYALLQPLTIAVGTVALHACFFRPLPDFLGLSRGRWLSFWPKLGYLLVLLWLLGDITASLRYHRALARSGGLADHSDASYHLAYYLQYNGLGTPIALDWGLDASVRYLSQGAVTPIELFGYGSLQEPDAQFANQLRPFLANPDNIYLFHAPGATVFQGRRAIFEQLVADQQQQAQLEISFAQRDGTPLYELWRVHRAKENSETVGW